MAPALPPAPAEAHGPDSHDADHGSEATDEDPSPFSVTAALRVPSEQPEQRDGCISRQYGTQKGERENNPEKM